ncbi:MAG: hypothetical protein SGILL_008842 [Bacillariaceae sp.]
MIMIDTSTPQQIQESQWKRPMATRRESSLKKNEKRVLLGTKFVPGPHAVICGRGKACTSSPGNKKLRAYVDSFAKSYGSAANKEQKSKIVSTIISLIEEPEGGAFVKFEESTWWKVDEAYAREKIGNLFRDVLHTKYRSSSKAKQARKNKTFSSSSSTSSSSSSEEAAAVVTPVKSSMDESISTSLSSTSTAPTLHMDLSYSSTSSSGSSMSANSAHGMAMCGGWNSNRNMRMLNPSSFPFMGMHNNYNSGFGGLSMSNFYNNHSVHNMNSRRNMLLSYCNEALNITSATPMMAMSSSCLNQVQEQDTCLPPYSEHEDESDEEVSLKDEPSKAITDEDEEDVRSIATFADDDIFNEFLVDSVDDLSGVF